MMILWAIVQSIVLYGLLFIARLLGVLLGFLIVPIAYPFKSGDHFPKWAYIWDNQEDGIYGPKWFGIYTNIPSETFKRCFLWSAVRNPANNMRYIDLFNVSHRKGIRFNSWGNAEVPEPQLARRLGGSAWHFTLVRQKGVWYFSWWYIRAIGKDRHFRIRTGWKCTPEWIKQPPSEFHNDVGMTFQLLPYRKG